MWPLIGVGKAFAPPLPPNRAGGFPAHGSPVAGFHIGNVSLCIEPWIVNSKKLRERGYSPPLTPLPAPTPCVPSVREASARHSTGVVIPPARVSSDFSLT